MLRDTVTASLRQVRESEMWAKVEPRIEALAQRKLPGRLETYKLKLLKRLRPEPKVQA